MSAAGLESRRPASVAWGRSGRASWRWSEIPLTAPRSRERNLSFAHAGSEHSRDEAICGCVGLLVFV